MSRSRAVRALVVSALSAVLAVVLSWAGAPAAGAGGSCGQPLSDARAVVVVTDEACFAPSVVRTAVGQPLTFTNRDGMDHTVTGVGHQWGTELPVGGSVTLRFAVAGTYPYFCHYHLGMVGTIVVGDGVATAASASPSAVTVVKAAAPTTVEATTPSTRPRWAAATRAGGSSGGRPYGYVVAAVAGVVLALGVVRRRRVVVRRRRVVVRRD